MRYARQMGGLAAHGVDAHMRTDSVRSAFARCGVRAVDAGFATVPGTDELAHRYGLMPSGRGTTPRLRAGIPANVSTATAGLCLSPHPTLSAALDWCSTIWKRSAQTWGPASAPSRHCSSSVGQHGKRWALHRGNPLRRHGRRPARPPHPRPRSVCQQRGRSQRVRLSGGVCKQSTYWCSAASTCP